MDVIFVSKLCSVIFVLFHLFVFLLKKMEKKYQNEVN